MKYLPNYKEFVETFLCKLVEHKKSIKYRGRISKMCCRLGEIWSAKNIILQSWPAWPAAVLFNMAENWWRICRNFLLQNCRAQKNGPPSRESFWNQLCVRRNFCCKTDLKFLAACHRLHRRAPMVHNSPSALIPIEGVCTRKQGWDTHTHTHVEAHTP